MGPKLSIGNNDVGKTDPGSELIVLATPLDFMPENGFLNPSFQPGARDVVQRESFLSERAVSRDSARVTPADDGARGPPWYDAPSFWCRVF